MPLEKLGPFKPGLKHHGKNYSNLHTLDCHWRIFDHSSLHWNITGWTITVDTHTPRHMKLMGAVFINLKWQDGWTPSSKWTGLSKLNFTALQCILFLLFKCVSTSTSLSACFRYEHQYRFCVFGVAIQMKSVQLRQLSPYQLNTKRVACWEVTWPADLQTGCCQYTEILLEILHLNHTGWCYHPVVLQRQSRAHLYNWNTPEDHCPSPKPVHNSWSSVHCNATEMSLVDPVYTGLPLGDPAYACRIHWNTTEKNLVETAPHWNVTGETVTIAAFTGTPLTLKGPLEGL